MACNKIHIIHGPGHESSITDYIWSEQVLDKIGKEFHVDRIAKRYDCDYPISKVTLVKRLPEKVIDRKLADVTY